MGAKMKTKSIKFIILRKPRETGRESLYFIAFLVHAFYGVGKSRNEEILTSG